MMLPMRAFIVAIAALAACQPDLGPSDTLVTTPRILAIKAEPADAKPNTAATYTALVASPDAAGDAASIVWRFCIAPKPLTENNSVSSECLDDASLVAAGTGSAVTAKTPAKACAFFGPDTPPGGFRPRDADVTGGYYQPLRADGADIPTVFYLARILCNLADAPVDVATEFAKTYTPNQNPHLGPLVARVEGALSPLDAIPAGARVELEASWPAEDAETYAYFDRASQTLVSKRESMRVAWFASDGTFDTGSTGRAEDDFASDVQNGWVAPPRAGAVRLWLVLRDSRGGTEFAIHDVTVR